MDSPRSRARENLAAFIPWVIGGASAAAVAALLALAVPAAVRVGQSSRFTDFLVLGMAGLAALGIAWETASVFWLAPCG